MGVGLILPIGALIAGAIYTCIFFIVSERRNKKFQETIQKSVEKHESELRPYLNGIPEIRNKAKQKALTSAINEYNNHNYNSAIRLFEQLLNQFLWSDSERCVILNFIGLALSEIEKYHEALKKYDEVVLIAERINDKEILGVAISNRGVALDILGRHDDAIKAFDKAIELNPDYAKAWYIKGIALGELGRHNDAIIAYDKVIELKPDEPDAWYNKACVYSLRGDKKNALLSLTEAIELDIEYKEEARKDEDFKILWNDPKFIKITS